MKQIYNFDQYLPPHLDETILRAKQARRNNLQCILILVIANVLSQMVLLLLGYVVRPVFPAFAMVMVGFVVISTFGSGLVAIVYIKMKGMSV